MLRTFYTNKIFKPIIAGYAVYMMHNFIRRHWPFEVFRHYKNAFFDIASVVSIWVMWFFEKHISLCSYISSVVPVHVEFASKLVSPNITFGELAIEISSFNYCAASTRASSCLNILHNIVSFFKCSIHKQARFVNKKNRNIIKIWQ